MWAYMVMYACVTVGPYAFSFFLPIMYVACLASAVVKQRLTPSLHSLGAGGYSVKLSLLLSCPPYVLAFVWVMTVRLPLSTSDSAPGADSRSRCSPPTLPTRPTSAP